MIFLIFFQDFYSIFGALCADKVIFGHQSPKK